MAAGHERSAPLNDSLHRASRGRQGLESRNKVSDVIIRSLRSDIASGNYPLGGRLPTEKTLAADFGVSQPTMRESLRALEAMGLIEARHGSGIYVAKQINDHVTNTLETLLQLEQVSILQAVGVRRVLGIYSGELALDRIEDSHIERMRLAARTCQETESERDFVEATIAFQAAFSAMTGNPLLFALETFLVRLLMQFQVHVNGSRGIGFWRDQGKTFGDHRWAIVHALDGRDRASAMKEWCGYLDDLQAKFNSDAILRDLVLSDPEAIRIVDDILLSVPSYEWRTAPTAEG